MENERENASARNRIDAIALSYLEILHQHLFWENRTLLFATRSPAMFRVMEYHPGVFQYPIETSSEDVEYLCSSARSWEYFAEIGYYLSKGRSKEDLDKLSRRKQWIMLRVKNLEDLKPQEISDFDESLSSIELDWGNIRGTFNLQGLGDQKHWNRLQNQDDILLMNVIRALLSDKLKQFVQEREESANKILDKIKEIMDLELRGSLPIYSRSAHVQAPTFLSASLLEHLLTVLDYEVVFQNHFIEKSRMQIVALFRLIGKSSIVELKDKSNELLRYASGSESDDNNNLLWISAVSLFFLERYERAAEMFEAWLLATKDTTSVDMLLLTRTLMADCFRNVGKDRSALQALSNIPSSQKRLFNSNQPIIIWKNLKVSLTSLLIENYGEKQQIFPHQPEKCAKDLLNTIKCYKKEGFITDRKFNAWCINNIIYLFARCIQPPKDSEPWLKKNINFVKTLSEDLKNYCEAMPVARYLHTLGYFHLKLYLYHLQISYRRSNTVRYYYDEAKNFFERSYNEAHKLNDKVTEELVQNHLQLAD